MPLTGPQIGRIHKAIHDAFDRDELRRVVRICMDERLETIVSGEKTFRAQVFELIEWADRNDCVADLLRCMHEDRPNNRALAALHGGFAAPFPAGRPAGWGAWAIGVAALVIVGALALYVLRDRIWPETSPFPAIAQQATPEEAARATIAAALAGPPAPAAAATPAAEAWTEPVSGMTFVRVPAGEFTMGSTDAQVDAALEMCNAGRGNCERAWFEGETPQHQVTLDEYWIGQTEVTNAQFRPFVEGGSYDDESLWTKAGWTWRTANGITRPGCWDDAYRNQPDHPVVCVNWHEALAYTRWLTRESGREFRLPTEAEWEKAACGTSGSTWPWGEEPPDANLANFNNNERRTTPGGSYPAGASPYGALDIAGNVWEWTSSLYQPYPYDAADGREDPEAAGKRTSRGGSFDDLGHVVRCAARRDNLPVYRFNSFGFRVMSPGF